MVKGELIEDLVMQSIIEILSNSKKFKQALLAPHPAENQKKSLEEELSIINDSIKKIEKKEQNLLNKIEEGVRIDGLQKRADKYSGEKGNLLQRKDEIENSLSNLPTEKEIQIYRNLLLKQLRNFDFNNLSHKKKRQIIEMFCQGEDPHGRPAGIYVSESSEKEELSFALAGLLGVALGYASHKDPDIDFVIDEDAVETKEIRFNLPINNFNSYIGSNGKRNM